VPDVLHPLTDPIRLGSALRDARNRRGWTQAHLAQRAKVSRAFVIDLERGRRPAAELARVLAVVRPMDLAVALVPAPGGRDFEQNLAALLAGEL
jgi:HTH-type transcriptional regulator / antitoxin HipB